MKKVFIVLFTLGIIALYLALTVYSFTTLGDAFFFPPIVALPFALAFTVTLWETNTGKVIVKAIKATLQQWANTQPYYNL